MLKKRKNLTERKALVLKDFLICAGSVRFSIFRSESKHSTFQQGFFVFFSFSSSQIIYFSIIFYFSRFLPKFCRLSRVQDIDLPLHIAAADAVCFVSSQVAGGWSLSATKMPRLSGRFPTVPVWHANRETPPPLRDTNVGRSRLNQVNNFALKKKQQKKTRPSATFQYRFQLRKIIAIVTFFLFCRLAR